MKKGIKNKTKLEKMENLEKNNLIMNFMRRKMLNSIKKI